MTVAERKRLSRIRKVECGSVELMVRLTGRTLDLVDQLADTGDVPRSEVVQTLLDLALDRLAHAINKAGAMYERHVPAEVVSAMIAQAIAPASVPNRHAAQKQKGATHKT